MSHPAHPISDDQQVRKLDQIQQALPACVCPGKPCSNQGGASGTKKRREDRRLLAELVGV